MSQTLVGVSVNPPPQFITLDNIHATLDVGHFFKPSTTKLKHYAIINLFHRPCYYFIGLAIR
jgi:hypothetical protein